MEAVVTVASHVTPAYILGLGPLKALIRPCPHRTESVKTNRRAQVFAKAGHLVYIQAQ